MKKKILMAFGGVFLVATGVAIMKLAAVGVDPYQTFLSGLDEFHFVQFGTLYVIVASILLVIGFFIDRKNIGIATFVNLFLLGYIVQFLTDLFCRLVPSPSYLERLIIMAVGVIVVCFGCSMMMMSELGVSAYDACAINFANHSRLSFRVCRIITDLICIAAGVVLFLLAGGPLNRVPEIAGIATIITGFFTGPIIDFFNRKVFHGQ